MHASTNPLEVEVAWLGHRPELGKGESANRLAELHRLFHCQLGRLKSLFDALLIIYAQYLLCIITAGVEPNPL